MSLVVIVDDQLVNQQVFSRVAASIDDGIEVRTFGDPAAALAWLSENTPDLIVTDYSMDGMDGAEFTRRVRGIAALVDVPVVIITVFEERSLRLRALNAGATDFLQSPIDHREFITRARNLLKMRKQQLQLASRADSLERKLEHSERSLKQAVRDSSERLAQVIDTVPAMVSATDRQGRFMFMNAYQTALLGLDAARVVGRDIAEILGDEAGARSKALDRMVFDGGRPLHSFEEEVADQGGMKRVFLTTKSPLKDAADGIIGVVTSSIDITELKLAERNLFRLAHHDPLTGLPNRIMLRDRLRREIALARRGDRTFALHLIDLDSFKGVNDVLGHGTGDKLLKAVAQRMRRLVRDEDTVARLGGDEFAVLQADVASNEAVAEFAAKLGQVVAEPYAIAGESLTTQCSIGIVVHPTDGNDFEELLRKADLAMYRAKAAGGNQHRFFEDDMNARAVQAAALDAELRKAVARQEFQLHYQPQLNLQTGEVIGVEALLRWRRENGTIIGPGGFLARAEENGLILPISEWVLREACRQAVAWRRAGLPSLRMGVNLSSVQLRNQGLPLLVAQVLAETGLDPHHLDLELTESMVMQDKDSVASQLRDLRELGVAISVDDFGTGYSSLSHVRHFAVDRLKIDQSFVRGMLSEPSDMAIVRTVISLGHSLDLKIVAEGVETAEQAAQLIDEGCDEGQGNHFGRPMPADDLAAFLRSRAEPRPDLAQTA